MKAVVIVGVGLMALAACGSTWRGAYSVGQVERDFAAHGRRLHQRRREAGGRIVVLAGRRVTVFVNSSEAGRAAFVWTGASPNGESGRTAALSVYTTAARSSAVEAALDDLRH